MNRILAILFAFLAVPCMSYAETIELVTYFPAGGPGGGGDLQGDTLRVGNAYANLPVPADGVALISNALAIGVPAPANGTIAPAADLQVVDQGNDSELLLERLNVDGSLNSQVLLAARTNRGTLTATGTLALGVNQTTHLFIQPTGNIGIGPENLFPVGALAPLHVVEDGPNAVPLMLEYFGAGAEPLFLEFRRRIGAPDAQVAIRNGDGLGELLFHGTTGAAFAALARGASINVQASGNWTAASAPADIRFSTTPVGWIAPTERLRITSGGNVAIGTNVPDAAAALQIESTTRGFLPSRMTTAQRDAIATPPEGLMIYNLTTHRMEVRTNTTWVGMGGGGRMQSGTYLGNNANSQNINVGFDPRVVYVTDSDAVVQSNKLFFCTDDYIPLPSGYHNGLINENTNTRFECMTLTATGFRVRGPGNDTTGSLNRNNRKYYYVAYE